ncbi:hypothetical protein M422DRAFT_243608 [Sphaerobolus stellatus SS14]|nr:hypothetical protein M422DRAFT_243608 [Sphaerobolus stellatus SS14]
MFKLSSLFIALLAGLSYASPVVDSRAGPPEADKADDFCIPAGLDKTVRYFLQSSGNRTRVWEAEEVTTGNFEFVLLAAKTNASAGTQALNNQLWAIQPVNHGNSFAIVSAGPTADICANGDGGPLFSFACPTVFSNSSVAQSSQFFITCKSCAANNQGATRCQIQSANEGQCASYLDPVNNIIKLDDCSSKANQPHQFWDIVVSA